MQEQPQGGLGALLAASGAGRARESEHEELPAPAHLDEVASHECLGRRVVGLQRRELEGGGALEARAGEDGVEPLGQGLHLRQLGHGPTLTVGPMADPQAGRYRTDQHIRQ